MSTRNVQGNAIRMGRQNTSVVLYVVLAALVMISVYFYWSLSSQVKEYKVEKRTLQLELTRGEEELNKLRNQLRTLTEELRQSNQAKSAVESESQKLKNELTEAKSSLVSATTKLTETKASSDSLQQQLSTRTDEVDRLTQESITKQSLIESCQKEKEECKLSVKSASNTCQDQLTTLQSQVTEEKKRYSSLLQDKNSLAAQFSEQGDKLQATENQLHTCQTKCNVVVADHTTVKPVSDKQPKVNDDKKILSNKSAKDDDNDEGQGGQAMLGVGGEEERQGVPQNPDIVLGVNHESQSQDRQSEKMGGVGTEVSQPKSRGEDAAPDYQSDFEQDEKRKDNSNVKSDDAVDNKDSITNADANSDVQNNKAEDVQDTINTKDVVSKDSVANGNNGVNSKDNGNIENNGDANGKENKENEKENDTVKGKVVANVDTPNNQREDKEGFDILTNALPQDKKQELPQYATEDNVKKILKRGNNFQRFVGQENDKENKGDFDQQWKLDNLVKHGDNQEFLEYLKNKNPSLRNIHNPHRFNNEMNDQDSRFIKQDHNPLYFQRNDQFEDKKDLEQQFGDFRSLHNTDKRQQTFSDRDTYRKKRQRFFHHQEQ